MSAAWLNGVLLPEGEAGVSLADRGFTLGDGLFETMRAYGGRVFRLDAHLRRLRAGAARIGLSLPQGLEAAIRDTLRASGTDSAVVRLTATRGPGEPGLRPPAEPRPTCAIVARPFHPRAGERTNGVRAILATGRLNEHAASAGLKRLGYLDAVLAQREALAAGADDALLLDTGGHLAEGAASNLFLVQSGTLLTPPLSCGILPGITRGAVLELAERLGMRAAELPLAPELLDTAEEAFLTSSVRELVPLVAVGGRAIGTGEPGPATRRLQAAYRALVEQELSDDAA